MKEIIDGMTVLVNSSGDFMFDGEAKRFFIGKQVTVIKKCKSGLYLVENSEGRQMAIAKFNLTIMDDTNGK